MIRQEHYDVVVLGGGSAGIAAATAAARHGARTVIVDAGPMIGGELVSGIPVDGCLSTAGEWVVGGICRDLFALCDRMGGYIRIGAVEQPESPGPPTAPGVDVRPRVQVLPVDLVDRFGAGEREQVVAARKLAGQ